MIVEIFSLSTCPVCESWCLEDHYNTDKAEIEHIVREHIIECFGITEIMTDLPWPA